MENIWLLIFLLVSLLLYGWGPLFCRQTIEYVASDRKDDISLEPFKSETFTFNRNGKRLNSKNFLRFCLLGSGLKDKELLEGREVLVDENIQITDLEKNDIIILKPNSLHAYNVEYNCKYIVGRFISNTDDGYIKILFDDEVHKYMWVDYVGRVEYIVKKFYSSKKLVSKE